MRSSTTSGRKIPTATYPNSSYVPLAVYRELAAQLQTAEARLDSLNIQNQHLAKQNQQLRQEIETTVQSILRLQQVANISQANQISTYYPGNNFRAEPSRSVANQRSSHIPTARKSAATGPSPFPISTTEPILPEKVITEIEEGRYRRRSQLERTSEVNGWGLAIAILLIVLTAFGAGYLIVRPLLPNR